MGLGPAYRSIAARAFLGPNRSQLIPAELHIGWLDSTGALIAMSGMSVTHDVFGPTTDGVTNISTIDGGVAGTGWDIYGVGLFDAPTSGTLVISAALPAHRTPAAGDALSFGAAALLFTVA